MSRQVDLDVYFRDTAIIVADQFGVFSYSPELAGEHAPATEVHIVMRKPKFARMAFVMRLKSRTVCEELIAALQSHMNEVWPIAPSGPGAKE